MNQLIKLGQTFGVKYFFSIINKAFDNTSQIIQPSILSYAPRLRHLAKTIEFLMQNFFLTPCRINICILNKQKNSKELYGYKIPLFRIQGRPLAFNGISRAPKDDLLLVSPLTLSALGGSY